MGGGIFRDALADYRGWNKSSSLLKDEKSWIGDRQDADCCGIFYNIYGHGQTGFIWQSDFDIIEDDSYL